MTTTIHSRDTLLGKSGRRFTTVAVDGSAVRLQSITELERSHLQSGNYRKTKDGLELDPDRIGTQPARLIALCVVDQQGNRFLSADDVGNMDAAVTATINAAARAHCGLDELEAPGKNLPETSASDSPTDSR